MSFNLAKNKIIKRARFYAGMGWRLCPIPKRNLKFPTGIPDWPNKATSDPDEIEQWLRQYRGANVCVACGPGSGIFVLDVDTKTSNGEETLEKFERQYGKLPDTRVHSTPSGGKHYFFSCSESTGLGQGYNKVGFAPGLDIRTSGGQVLLPPSVTEANPDEGVVAGEYKVLHKAPIAKAPEWLLTLIKTSKNQREAEDRKPPFELPAEIEDGTRNKTLHSYAGKLRREGSTQDEIVTALRKVNDERCASPLSEKELTTIAASICKHPPGERAAKSSQTNPLPASLQNLEPVDRAWFDDEPPPLKKVLNPYFHELEIAQVAGQAGVSKTTLMLHAAASMATGTPFFGYAQAKGIKVMYLMLERHERSFRRRWWRVTNAIADTMRDKPKERKTFLDNLMANSYARTLTGENLNLIEHQRMQWALTPAVDALIAELKAAGIRVLIFDPLSRLHGGDEDLATMSVLMRAFERIVQQAGCTVIFVHHSGITARGGKYAGRGSSVLTDNTSETLSVEEMKPDDLEKYDLSGLGDDTAASVIRVEHARCSDGAPAKPMFLVRSSETGMLRIANIRFKNDEDKLKAFDLPRFQEWAQGRKFTRTQFASGRKEAFEFKLSERQAEELFESARQAGRFEVIGDLKGHPLYSVAAQGERQSGAALCRSAGDRQGRAAK